MDREINYKKLKKELLSLLITTFIMAILYATDLFNMEFINHGYIILTIILSFIIAFLSVLFKYKPFSKKLKYRYYEIVDFMFMLNLALLFVQLFFVVGFYPAKVEQQSMMNTLMENDKIIIQRLGKPKNFDIVILEPNETYNGYTPQSSEDRFIVKRVIAVGGDTFYFDEDGVLYLNNVRQEEIYLKTPLGDFLPGRDHFRNVDISDLVFDENVPVYEIPQDYYFVLGDNRDYSLDSEELGLFHKSQVKGIAKYRRIGFLDWKKL